MELNLYYGGIHKTFIVSKYVKRFIMPLHQIKSLLSYPNLFEVLKTTRKGKLFNTVIMTSEAEKSAVVSKKEVAEGIFFMAKRKGSPGFSSMVVNGDYSNVLEGVLTLILKEHRNPHIDGYFLNAFWGYPVKAEPFGKFETFREFQESKTFWENNCFRADKMDLDLNALLFKKELTDAEQKLFEKLYKTQLTYLGNFSISKNYRECVVDSRGDWVAYRGVNV